MSEFRAKFDKFEKFGGTVGGASGLKKTAAPPSGSISEVKNADVEKTVKVCELK